MKKLIAVLAIISFNAHAAPDCRELPSCESLGFICSAEECSDLKALSCPFDLSKKACFPKEKECEVGDILYNDLKCYDSGCGKTPIAVVYDAEYRLAMPPLQNKNTIWGGYGYDIPDLETCGYSDDFETCGTDGKTNTQIIINYGKENELSFPPAEFCYNSTYGDTPQGTYWLPSVKEVFLYGRSYAVNKEKIKQGLAVFNHTPNARMWSSTERGSTSAWSVQYTDESKGAYAKQGDISMQHCITGY